MNRPDLVTLRDAVAANIQAGADLLSERRMLRLLDALLGEGATPPQHEEAHWLTCTRREPGRRGGCYYCDTYGNWSA